MITLQDSVAGSREPLYIAGAPQTKRPLNIHIYIYIYTIYIYIYMYVYTPDTDSEGGMIRSEALIELKFVNSSFASLSSY